MAVAGLPKKCHPISKDGLPSLRRKFAGRSYFFHRYGKKATLGNARRSACRGHLSDDPRPPALASFGGPQRRHLLRCQLGCQPLVIASFCLGTSLLSLQTSETTRLAVEALVRAGPRRHPLDRFWRPSQVPWELPSSAVVESGKSASMSRSVWVNALRIGGESCCSTLSLMGTSFYPHSW